ncbi:hypothetical protein KIPB_014077, partial [Kipferlia bialata]|eukprot:g14077.t1
MKLLIVCLAVFVAVFAQCLDE